MKDSVFNVNFFFFSDDNSTGHEDDQQLFDNVASILKDMEKCCAILQEDEFNTSEYPVQ